MTNIPEKLIPLEEEEPKEAVILPDWRSIKWRNIMFEAMFEPIGPYEPKEPVMLKLIVMKARI